MPRREVRRLGLPALSVIIPAYNEEANLEVAVSTTVATLDATDVDWEIIIVNDGSTDRTRELADECGSHDERISVIHHPANKGLGAAIRTGLREARGQYVIWVSCDSPFEKGELDPFLASLDKADVVVGYRSGRPGYSRLMRLNSRIYTSVVGWLFGMRLRDFNYVHMYRKKVLESLQWRETRIFWLAEALIRARDAGYSIMEVPAVVRARTTGRATASRPSIMLRTAWDCLVFALWYYLLPSGRRSRRMGPSSPTDEPRRPTA